MRDNLIPMRLKLPNRGVKSPKKKKRPKPISRKKPPIQHPRDAMGGYAMPEGGKPLTSLGLGNPSPQDYDPKTTYTTHTYPSWSIKGRRKQIVDKGFEASPADLNIAQPPEKEHTYNYIKGKWNKRNEAYTTGKGPAAYHVGHHKEVGIDDYAHWSMGRRFQGRHMTGPPNKLLAPVDTPGFESTAMEYLPESDRGLKKSFGIKVTLPGPTAKYPAPNAYAPVKVDQHRYPAFALSDRHELPNKMGDQPGPAHYNLGTTLGKGPGKSMSGWYKIEEKVRAPDPTEYDVRSCDHTSTKYPSFSMTYRPFPPIQVDNSPGPGSYDVDSGVKLIKPNARAYTMRPPTKKALPDIMIHPESLLKGSEPSPGEYHNENNTIVKNSGPRYSFGRVLTKKAVQQPAPNEHVKQGKYKSAVWSGPSFSLGKKIPVKYITSDSPGPAAYYPDIHAGDKRSGFKWPLGAKLGQAFSAGDGPGPLDYHVVPGSTRFGDCVCKGWPKFTFKGRPSPFLYTGLQAKVNL